MTEGEEYAHHGYDLLLKRPDFQDFFDHLNDAGLFSPERNQGPVPADKPGYVRIPYWEALDYLEAVAKRSGETDDLFLAGKILNVIRNVSQFKPQNGLSVDNYHTCRKFADILGIVPVEAIADEDIELLPIWLHSKYDRGLVGHSIAKGLLRRLLESDTLASSERACRVLFHCTEIQWVDEERQTAKQKKPVTVVEAHWLKKLINKHSNSFGLRAGKSASNIFSNRVREVFEAEDRSNVSWLFRPAVEDHPQNHSWNGSENVFVEGLRDVLLSWVASKSEEARPHVKSYLEDGLEILRRVAIYLINARWETLHGLYVGAVKPDLFQSGHLHELYDLLVARFNQMDLNVQNATLQAIRGIPVPLKGEDPERRLRYVQRNWLLAIKNRGLAAADSWFDELNVQLGSQSEHPSFQSYMESWSGPGPSPYGVPELIAFANSGDLIAKLNEFSPVKEWYGPRAQSTRALVDALEGAIKAEPTLFIHQLPNFLAARRPYQYGVINAYKNLWVVKGEKDSELDWNRIWSVLFGFFESLLMDEQFWEEAAEETQDLTPNRNWIPPLISDFLRAGTKDDSRAYEPQLLPRGWKLIQILLARSEPVKEANVADAMTQAINAPRGQTIEAFFSHMLRACRLSDQVIKNHLDVFDAMRSTLDEEIAKCQEGNFEFSTLAANYIANLEYVSQEWLGGHIKQIFPQGFRTNFECAVEGLAYASASRSIYQLLLNAKVVERTLELDLKGRHARDKMLERVGLAYLWGDESLDSARFSIIFAITRDDDLRDMSRFFWSVSNQTLSEDQVERIVVFWERCVAWSNGKNPKASELLSELSRLSVYITSVSERAKALFLAVAPYVEIGYNADEFVENLDRLAEENPEFVSMVLGKTLETYRPTIDFQNRLRSTIEKIAKKGRREDAIVHLDKLKHLPGFLQLYEQLATI